MPVLCLNLTEAVLRWAYLRKSFEKIIRNLQKIKKVGHMPIYKNELKNL